MKSPVFGMVVSLAPEDAGLKSGGGPKGLTPRRHLSCPERRHPARKMANVNAIVTGASRGIGRGIAQELSKTHRVLGTWLGSQDHAESLHRESGCEIFRCDI